MNPIAATMLICLVIDIVALSIVSWRILIILENEWDERINKLRVEVEAAKREREEVKTRLAERRAARS